MSNTIDIPDSLLERYTDLNESEPLTPGESRESLDQIADFCGWIVNVFDEQAKQAGYPGTGKVPANKLGELYARVAERNLSDAMLRKTPEMAAASLTVGILSMNFVHARKQKLQAADQEAESTKNE